MLSFSSCRGSEDLYHGKALTAFHRNWSWRGANRVLQLLCHGRAPRALEGKLVMNGLLYPSFGTGGPFRSLRKNGTSLRHNVTH